MSARTMFPQIFGKYVLERELASGGMARVYLATLRGAVGFEKRLVVKQIRPELASDYAFVQRFVEEAKTAVELSHPNIVPVYELGVEQGVYYIAMELCTGVTLAEVLASTGKLSPEEGAYVGVEICRALDYAHRRAGIVHRDATPRNVLVDEEGAIKLIDFGIALPVARDGSKKSDVFGSPGHMPPEQLAGKPLTPAADVFAVAALLVEAWSGRAPFRRASAQESHEALNRDLPPVSDHDEKLEPLNELLASALAHDPTQRPAQAELFARPLRDFLRSVDSGDLARRLGARVRKAKRRAERGSSTTGRESSPSYPGGSDPRTPTGPAVLSRTFAARDEVEQWTRRLDSSPPKADTGEGPSTRKLPSIPPVGTPPMLTAGSPSERDRRVAVTDPDPLAINDTPPQAISPRGSAAPGRPLRTVGTAFGVLGLALGVVWIAQTPGRATRAEVLPKVAVAPKPSPAPPRGAVPSAAVTGAPSIAAPLAVRTPSKDRPVITPAPAAAANGVLRLTADPPAVVSIHGAGKSRTLRTPVRELRLPSGSYTVTFQSETYDAPVIAKVLVEGERVRSVHADFREVDPRVTVR